MSYLGFVYDRQKRVIQPEVVKSFKDRNLPAK